MFARSKARVLRLEAAATNRKAQSHGQVIIVDIPPGATDETRVTCYQRAARTAHKRAGVVLMLPDNRRGVIQS